MCKCLPKKVVASCFIRAVAIYLSLFAVPLHAAKIAFNDEFRDQGFARGSVGELHSFDLEAGEYQLSLKDFETPAPFTQLAASVSTATQVIDSISFDSTTSQRLASTLFSIDAASEIYLAIYGLTDPQFSLGFYEVQLALKPPAPIPLPMAWVLMVSGAGMLFSLGRRKTKVAYR